MKPISIIIVAILVIAVAGVFILSAMGMINLPGFDILGGSDAPPGGVKQVYSDLEVVHVLEVMFGRDLVDQDVLPYVDALHMELYGVNDQTAYEIYTWYQNKYTDEGYTSLADTYQFHTGWGAYHEIWYQNNTLMGKSVSVGDGAAVKTAYDYDTMVLTSYGSMTTYEDFIRVVL